MTFFKNVVNVFSLFRHFLPLEMGVVFHLNKINSLFTQGEDVFQVLNKIGLVVLDTQIFKCYFLFRYLTLKLGVALHLNKL